MNRQRGSRAGASAALGAVVTTVLTLGLALAPAASAADAGISGTVRNGTTGEVVAGLAVTVTFFDADSKLGVDKQTTAADGTFTSIPPASAAGYQVTATFKGTEYRTQATQLLSGQPSVATLDVYEPSSDPKDIATTQAVLWVDRENGAFAVQEDYGWKNGGKTAYVGAKGGSVISLPLPEGATNLQFLGTFLEQRGAVKDGAYVSEAPIVPGKSSATIRFTIASLTTISLPVTFPTAGIQLFVPEGIRVSAAGVRLAGTIQDTGANGQPVTYQQYVVDGPAVGATIDVALAETAAAGAGSTDWTTILLVVAGLAALAALAFAIVGRRRAKQRTPVRAARSPKARSAAKPSRPTTPKVAAPAKARTSNGHRNAPPRRTASVTMPAQEDDDVQLLVDEIAALDLSFENGVLDERTYRRLRVAAKDRLLLAQEASARGVPR
ncbi:MAG: carboxypeptidase-like regulatory domain-containing protein [Planctomycetaceae bacterium]